jgi:hypothetical protein
MKLQEVEEVYSGTFTTGAKKAFKEVSKLSERTF